MRHTSGKLILAMAVAIMTTQVLAQPVPIVGIVELSGAGARYIKDSVKAKTVAVIYVNNDFGKGGRDAIVKDLEAQGIKVVADISTDPGQVDFSGPVLKVKQSNADALFVYTNEEESARALRELRKQGYDRPIIGESTLTNEKVIELAGDAANGVVAHVGLTADVPYPTVQAFVRKYEAEYKSRPDHNAMKGAGSNATDTSSRSR